MNLALFGKVRIAPEIRRCPAKVEFRNYSQFWQNQFDRLDKLLVELTVPETCTKSI